MAAGHASLLSRYVAQEPNMFSGTVAENVVLAVAGVDPRTTLHQAAGVAGLIFRPGRLTVSYAHVALTAGPNDMVAVLD